MVLGNISVCMEKFVQYFGDNIAHNFTSATTPTKCQELCQSISDCVAFTWDQLDVGAYRCDLKSTVIWRQPSFRPPPFLISGPKYCLGKKYDKSGLGSYQIISK